VLVMATRLLVHLTRRASNPGSITIRDADRLHDPFRFRPGEIDRQQPRSSSPHPILPCRRQHEGALELACGDAAMEIVVLLVVLAGGPRITSWLSSTVTSS